jgi:Asp/Glu/hydantoin racemase
MLRCVRLSRPRRKVDRVKILLINPNTSEGVTQRIRAAALAAASPGTEILAVTASKGVRHIP